MAEPQGEGNVWNAAFHIGKAFCIHDITAHMLTCTKPAQDPGGQCSSMGMGGTPEDPPPAEELLGANSC